MQQQLYPQCEQHVEAGFTVDQYINYIHQELQVPSQVLVVDVRKGLSKEYLYTAQENINIVKDVAIQLVDSRKFCNMEYIHTAQENINFVKHATSHVVDARKGSNEEYLCTAQEDINIVKQPCSQGFVADSRKGSNEEYICTAQKYINIVNDEPEQQNTSIHIGETSINSLYNREFIYKGFVQCSMKVDEHFMDYEKSKCDVVEDDNDLGLVISDVRTVSAPGNIDIEAPHNIHKDLPSKPVAETCHSPR